MSSTFQRQKHVKRVLAGLVALLGGIAVWQFARRSDPALDSRAVVAQVQRLNQLTTVRYTVQKVVDLEEPRQPVGSERILLVLEAAVTAGVDLASLTAADVGVERGGAVVIRLPRARLLSVAVEEESTRVWDRSKTWWTPWIPYGRDLERRARLQGMEAARQAALEMGILDQAQRNAEDAIRGLLSLVGVGEVRVLPQDAT